MSWLYEGSSLRPMRGVGRFPAGVLEAGRSAMPAAGDESDDGPGRLLVDVAVSTILQAKGDDVRYGVWFSRRRKWET